MLKKNLKSFTLLELIIVIIIVAVLASLALPRFFSMVEFSKNVEAVTNLKIVRDSVNRCVIMNSGLDAGCVIMADLDVENPDDNPTRRFAYAFGVTTNGGWVPPTYSFTVVATRNAVDGGDGSSKIELLYDTNTGTSLCGTVVFSSLGACP